MTPVPGPLARVAELMSTFRPRWSLCGGWAVDAWLGRQTRDHPDLDITIFNDDPHALLEHLAGWQLIAHDTEVDGGTAEPWNGRALTLPAHIHARSPERAGAMPDRLDAAPKQGFGLEIILNERSARDWILSREPRITMPLRRCARQPAWGLPTVVPEVLLFYKATADVKTLKGLRPHDELDFLALLPHLTEEQWYWLWEAISLVHPGHPWLAHLSPEPPES